MKTVTCVVVLGLVAMSANAAIVPNTDLTLLIQTDGSAELVNMTGAPLGFDALYIKSVGGHLNAAAWVSIEEAYVADWMTTAIALGSGAGGMGEFMANANTLAEGSLGTGCVLQAGASWSIGSPSDIPSEVDLTLYWTNDTTIAGDQYQGGVTVVPEPTTMAVLSLGLVGFIARKKRS